mmetsp:Transcript_13946/g.20602  ORF Transcript_13946/g.20602 Transcript_13946/m.20602 type:complete len:464 (+) Transcript_13946:44-1435(+)
MSKSENEEENPREEEEEVIQHHDVCASIASIAGNALEWYDFGVFGYFSDIIGDVFFPPNQTGNAALVKTFAVFGGAFLVRPIGGVLIGILGDNVGRKSAVQTSIFLMVFPTVALGCLPTYEMAGGFATFLLIIMRLLQGLSVGGQLMSSVVFTLERTDESRWGLWGSSVFAVSSLGVSLGSFLSYILRQSLDQEQLRTWGWRLPFLLGIFGVLPGVYLKYHAKEHHVDESNTTNSSADEPHAPLERKNTFIEALKPSNRRALISSALVPCLSAATYYIVFIWLAVFMESILTPPIPHAFAINTAVGLVGILFVFVGGWLADRLRRYRLLMFLSSAAIAIAGPLALHLISLGDPGVAFVSQAAIALFLAIWQGSMIPWMIKNFPPNVRLTSVSLGYNLAVMICGGFAPAVATLLVDNVSVTSPGYIMTVLTFVSWIGLCIVPKQETLQNDDNLQLQKNSEVQLT